MRPLNRDELEKIYFKSLEVLGRHHLARLEGGDDGSDMIRTQKSLICDDITGLPETDEVQEMLFKIQDLLVPFLPDEYPDENA